jgi:hypothetical protein
MRARFRLILVVAALLVGATATVVLAQGGGNSAGSQAASTPAGPTQPLPPIQGPALEFEGLVYNITDVRVLNLDSPSDAPYLVNEPRLPKGSAYLGVFLRIYNRGKVTRASAPGYLLEPQKAAIQVRQMASSQSPYQLAIGAKVAAGSMLPVPGTASAAGKLPGALMTYVIDSGVTKNQPVDLVIHAPDGALAKLALPPLPSLTGGHIHS